MIIHLLLPFDPKNLSSIKAAGECKKQAALKAISLNGTVSGEHGIGLGNRECALQQYGRSLPYMRQLKTIFDPKGIMNPGKVI